MSIRDRVVLARQFAKASGGVGLDAVRTPFGLSLPLQPAALTDPARFRALLAAGPVAPWAGGARPHKVERTLHEAPSSNCVNSVFRVSWEGEGDDSVLPSSIFVKQPSGDLATRVFANLIGFWKIECAVCRNLSSSLPIETPEIYSVVEQGSRFVIMMENLLERPGVELFVNRHLLDGVDLATARRALRTLAQLHAGLSGWSADRQERALSIQLHPFRSPTLRPVMLAVNRQAAAPCRERAPELFDEQSFELYGRTLGRWKALESAWYEGPLTLVHGDSHLGNFFITDGGMGMLDFQGAHWGKGMRDVQYFLINSMRSDLLAEHERELVAAYAEEVTRLGAPLARELAWTQYRASSFQTLMTAVVSLGLGSFTDSDAVMRSMLERSVAAVRRVDFAGWLDAL